MRQPESYQILGELSATVEHMTQILTQLATWHSTVQDGTHYNGEDSGEQGSAAAVSTALSAGAAALVAASAHLDTALACNGVLRWYPTPKPVSAI